MEVYIGWNLLIPIIFYMLRGYTSLLAIEALGYSRRCTFARSILYILPEMLLFSLWCMMEIQLTVVFVLAFICHAFRWCIRRSEWPKGFFMVSLVQPLIMAFHMILIGVFSLNLKMPMEAVLQRPFLRIMSITIVLLSCILSDLVILKWSALKEALGVQAVSEERRPFLVFLWFCNIFLILDSLLCTAGIQWKLLPLLLIGAAAFKEFIILHCLLHLRSIIQERYIKEQHQVLVRKLKQQERRTEELKNKSERDALTGLFSRQYLLEQMELLWKEKRAFTVAFIDLDGLKKINDSQGHVAGDRYLTEFSHYIIGQLREGDVFARIGGDEFVILLLDCDKTDAEAKLRRVRSKISGEEFEYVPSFSFGTAEADFDTEESAFQLLERADQGMYQDKKSRRK